MRRMVLVLVVACGLVATGGTYAAACGDLVAANGAVHLVRTTTLAAYHDGVEHYVTSFQFESPEQSFGSIIPLPAAPTNVERGGSWTLQRLEREVSPVTVDVVPDVLPAAGANVQVLQQVQIDALTVTVLRGGGAAVAQWAAQQGFTLPKDTPSVLDFYSRRSPFFLAARYDATSAAARGLRSGDGIPVELTIPVSRPWVPLHILGAGKETDEVVNADVFLLTDAKPSLLAGAGLHLRRSERAPDRLLNDLRGDQNMNWVPTSAYLSYLQLSEPAPHLSYDLAIGVNGHQPRLVDTGAARRDAVDEPTLAAAAPPSGLPLFG
jgi:Uncharacterized protein conserved in bacteria (DUF2330)